MPEFKHWQHFYELPQPITIEGQVVNGFKRGSKELGVPTANIEMTPENIEITKSLVPGVYAAMGTLDGKDYPWLLASVGIQSMTTIQGQ